MAVTVRSKNEAIATGTSPTVGEPAGAASGDLLFAFALCSTAGAVTSPAGWTDIAAFAGTQGTVTWRVSYVQRGGSAPNLTWGLTGSVYYEIYIVCLQATAPIVLDSQSAAGASAVQIPLPDPPSTTAVATASLALCGGLHFSINASNTWTAPAGYAVQTANALGSDGLVCSKTLSASGAENPAIFTGDLGASNGDMWNGFTVTFAESSSRRWLMGRH